MKSLLAESVFEVSGARYSWGDVIAAARLRGEWPAVVTRAREGLELLQQADANESKLASLPSQRLEERAAAFRYERNLETAEEMEAWLRRWGLSPAQWTHWLWAELLREHLPAAPRQADAASVAAADLDAAVHSEAVCSREIERFAERLAERAAIHELRRNPGDPDDAPHTLPELAARDFEVDAERVATLARQERAFRAFLSDVVTPKALEAQFSARRFDWARIRYETAAFDSADQAREACLAASEDGLTLEEAAAAACTAVERRTTFVDEIDEAIRDWLAAARPGRIVGPIPADRKWALYHVVDRIAASLDDDAVLQRARSALVGTRLAREVSNRVRWRWRP